MSLAEELINNKIKPNTAKRKDIVMVKPDCVMIHDLFIPFVVNKFHEMGFKKVWNSDKIVIIYDHLVPASSIEDVRHYKIAERFAKEQGITKLHKCDGVCHQIMHELKYVLPSDIVFGTDSHTVTYGAIGAFATGIGYTDMAAILGTGETWIRVPETIRIKIDGKIPDGVYSKDIILKIISDLKVDGATYKSLEFVGSTVDDMSISSRLTIANMAVEAGAKVGLFYPDQKTADYCNIPIESLSSIKYDKNTGNDKIIEYDAPDFKPVVAFASNVDNVKTIDEIGNINIDQVFIGSCTNGRLEDLEIASNILRGKKVHGNVRLIVTPASRNIYEEAAKNGILEDLIEADAIVTNPSCGLCCGRYGGIVSAGEKVLATNNRNFLGRMGSSKAEIFLASPATAAYSAIAGVIKQFSF